MANSIQYSFERYEKKYFLTPSQQTVLIERINQHMKADKYGKYTICNIYYDTDDWKLIRASIEKPAYKEKLRVRSYGIPKTDGKVFIELKKKFSGVVYKRRMDTSADLVKPFLSGIDQHDLSGQIANEIKWFQDFHHSKPKIFIGYDRIAFAGIDDPNLRITFDTNMRWRDNALDLRLGDHGTPIIGSDKILMEIKIPGTCPLWLSRLLSEIRAFPTSFSKYGTCYRDHILTKKLEGNKKEGLLSA